MVVDTSAVMAILLAEPEAKAMDEPLLFKGSDFSRTDIAQARP